MLGILNLYVSMNESINRNGVLLIILGVLTELLYLPTLKDTAIALDYCADLEVRSKHLYFFCNALKICGWKQAKRDQLRHTCTYFSLIQDIMCMC